MYRFFRHYAHFYRHYTSQLTFAIIGMIVAAASTAWIAYLIKPVLDEIFIQKDLQMLQMLPFLVIAAYAGKGIGTYIQTYYTAYVGKDIIRRVKDEFLAHILRLDLAFFHANRGGELISRIVNDTNKIQQAVSTHAANFLREILTAIALIGVVIYQSPKLAFFGLVVLPLAFYPLSLLARRMKKISHRVQEKTSDIVASLGEIFNNIEIIKANTTERAEQQRVAAHNQSFFSYEMKAVKTSEAVNPLMELLGAFAAAGVIVAGGHEVIEGHISVGAFFSFMTALFMLYTPIRQISSIYNRFQEAIAANDRIVAFRQMEPAIQEGPQILEGPVHQITLSNLSLHYGDVSALSHINLTITHPECVALVGPSGSGKSSLVNLLLRFYEPSSGTILLNETPLSEFTLASLRQNIAIVTQRVYIFNDSIAANVAYGSPLDESQIEQALRQAHAWEFVNKLEQGIHTPLQEFGANLSGGQRQRIAIARALYRNPAVLVLDEATSALDNESEQEITTALEQVKKDRLLIIIAHRPSTLRLADRIYVFEEGRLVGEGSEQELLTHCETYQRLYTHPGSITAQ